MLYARMAGSGLEALTHYSSVIIAATAAARRAGNNEAKKPINNTVSATTGKSYQRKEIG